MQPDPKPLEIWKMKGNQLWCDQETLSNFLDKPEYCGKNVVVIVATGPMRLGKSFMLNYLLRYLKASDKTSWMGESDAPLIGFRWDRSSTGVTDGIQLWSEPFVVKLSDGKEVIVLVMDTQGTFDMKSSFTACSKIFAFSVYVSSMLIYNLQGQILQNSLGYLHFFTHYGRMLPVDEKESDTLYQQLTFLVRDWPNDHEYPFGLDGGKCYLDNIMKTSPEEPAELKETKLNLNKIFSSINCYLMRHPEFSVIRDPRFTGQLSLMNEEFVTYLKQFVETYLAESNINVKEINGRCVLWEQLPVIFQTITEALNRSDLPEPDDIVHANKKLQGIQVIEQCSEIYNKHMSLVDYKTHKELQTNHFYDEHYEAVNKAFELLKNKLPNDGLSAWENLLQKKLSELRQHFFSEFMILLHSAQESYNEKLMDECVDDFIVLLPMKSKDFDPRKFVQDKFDNCVRGDVDMQNQFRARFTERLKPAQVLYECNNAAEYLKRTNFPDAWRRKARREQQEYGLFFHTRLWNEINCSTMKDHLQSLVSCALFGKAKADGDGYELVRHIVDHMIRLSKVRASNRILRFAIIFVHGMCEKYLHTATYPIFRIMRGDGRSASESYFVDHCGRLYDSWNAYLKENLLDGYLSLIPKDGQYIMDGNEVRLCEIDLRYRDVRWKNLDTAMSILGVTSAAVAVAGGVSTVVFPPTALVALTWIVGGTVCSAVGLYQSGRIIARIADRAKHGQRVWDKQAINDWVHLAVTFGLSVTLGAQTVINTLRLFRIVSVGECVLGTSTACGFNCSTFEHPQASRYGSRYPEKRLDLSALLLMLTNCYMSPESYNLEAVWLAAQETYAALQKNNPTTEFIKSLDYI